MTTYDWFTQYPIDAHKQAVAFADAAVPGYDHTQWLRFYNMALFRLMMGSLYGHKQ